VKDVTMTHDRYGRTTQRTNGALTHRVSSTGTPQSDGSLNKVVRIKIRHYRQIYVDSPDPIVFLPVTVTTSGRVYDDFRLCARSWLARHPVKTEITGSSGGSSHHTKFFFFSKIMIFLDF
jgi:hypothetical protein